MVEATLKAQRIKVSVGSINVTNKVVVAEKIKKIWESKIDD